MNGWNYVIILLIKRTEEWGAAALPITRLPAPLANCLCSPFPSWPPWILAHTLQMGKVPSAPCPQTARLNYVTSSFRTFPGNFLSLFQGSPHRVSSSCRSTPRPYALIASIQSSKVVQDQHSFLSFNWEREAHALHLEGVVRVRDHFIASASHCGYKVCLLE